MKMNLYFDVFNQGGGRSYKLYNYIKGYPRIGPGPEDSQKNARGVLGWWQVEKSPEIELSLHQVINS